MASFDSSSAASPGAPRFAILTLGCRVNQYESGVMRRDLATRGLVEVPFEEAAECYVINTCTVTHLADRKSRQMIRRALRLNPAAHVFAVGCGALCDGEAFTRISGRIVVLSNEEKHTLAERAAGLLSPCAGNDAGAGSRASPQAARAPDRTQTAEAPCATDTAQRPLRPRGREPS